MSDTIFGKILRNEIPAPRVWDDDQCIAIRDINPQAPTHILVIPREHIGSLAAARAHHSGLLGHMTWVAVQLAEREGLAPNGYRLVWNCGADGGQTVAHIHLHLLGGRALDWPPG